MRVKGVSNWQSGVQLFRGRFQVYGHPKFGMIITKWPRKRGPAKTPAARINQNTFAQVVAWAKNPMASELEEAQRGTFQTGYLIRDAIESQCYGLVSFGYDEAGNYIISQRLGNMQIQPLLDSISMTPGTMLVRGADAWIALEAGLTGQVLTSSGPLQPPSWLAGGSSSGAAGLQLLIPPANTTTELGASIINMITPAASLKLSAMQATLSTVTGATYNFFCAPWDRTTHKLTAAPTFSTDIASPGTVTNAILYSDFAALIDVTTSSDWIVGLRRADAGATLSMKAAYIGQPNTQNGWLLSIPYTNGLTAWIAETNAPDETTTWTAAGSAIWALSMVYTKA